MAEPIPPAPLLSSPFITDRSAGPGALDLRIRLVHRRLRALVFLALPVAGLIFLGFSISITRNFYRHPLRPPDWVGIIVPAVFCLGFIVVSLRTLTLSEELSIADNRLRWRRAVLFGMTRTRSVDISAIERVEVSDEAGAVLDGNRSLGRLAYVRIVCPDGDVLVGMKMDHGEEAMHWIAVRILSLLPAERRVDQRKPQKSAPIFASSSSTRRMMLIFDGLMLVAMAAGLFGMLTGWIPRRSPSTPLAWDVFGFGWAVACLVAMQWFFWKVVEPHVSGYEDHLEIRRGNDIRRVPYTAVTGVFRMPGLNFGLIRIAHRSDDRVTRVWFVTEKQHESVVVTHVRRSAGLC